MHSSHRIEMVFCRCPQRSAAGWSIGGYTLPEEFIVERKEDSPAYLLNESVEIDHQPFRTHPGSMEWLTATYIPRGEVIRKQVLIPVREVMSYRETYEVHHNRKC